MAYETRSSDETGRKIQAVVGDFTFVVCYRTFRSCCETTVIAKLRERKGEISEVVFGLKLICDPSIDSSYISLSLSESDREKVNGRLLRDVETFE